MAVKIASGSPLATEFFALDSAEKQTMYMIAHVQALENGFNSANPDNLQNRATVAVNYDTKTATGQLTLNLVDNVIQGKLVDGVVAYLP